MNILTYLREKAKNKTNESASSQKDNYNDKLKELEDFLSDETETPDLLDFPKYERYEYEAPSDEEITSSAQRELEGYRNSGESSIKNEYAQKEKQLEKERAAKEKMFDDSNAKLEAAYRQVSESLGNDALKRGLARSSIALNNQAEAGKAYTQSAKELIDEYNGKISSIDEELAGLDAELQRALDSFKIGYAAQLSERINELKSEREKNKLEALKYNNSLIKDEYEDRLAKQKTTSSAKKMTEKEKEAYEKRVYDKMNEVLSSLPIEEARELFNGSTIFRDNLSDKYYYSLHSRFS